MAEILQTKSVYTLQDPVWIRNGGLPKGIDHDKQPLGIILAPGARIRLRQISPGFTSSVWVVCTGDGTAPTQWATVGSTWVELIVTGTLVPFIVTPYVAGTSMRI